MQPEELSKVARAHEAIEAAHGPLVVEALGEEHRDTAWRSIVRDVRPRHLAGPRRPWLDDSQAVDAAHVLLVAGCEAWPRAG